MWYRVVIEEILRREVLVEADSEQEAIDKTRGDYGASDIILDSSDYVSTDIYIANN